MKLFLFLSVFILMTASTNISAKPLFTQDESSYLQQKKQITMCIDPNWMPFEKIENKKHVGMTADFMKLFEESIGVPIVMIPSKTWTDSIELAKNRQCDIFSLAMETKERKEYMNFTQPYLRSPLIIATRMSTLFITDPQDVIVKPFGITKGYAYIEILKKKYPNINLVEFESLSEGLNALREGEIFGYIDNLITTGYAIQKSYYGELKIAGKFDDKWELGVGTRNDEPQLLTIFNKAIKDLSKEQKNAIINKWISVKYDAGFDYSLFWKIFFVIAIAVLFGAYRHFALRKLINQLQEKDKKLQELTIRDSLSKLYNRRHFETIFSAEFKRSKRDNKSFIFAMIDIDFFKKYNDTYGHQKGDEAIRKVSQVLLQHTKRSGDFSFRIGGEEFAIILQADKHTSYIDYLQGICHSVENLHIEHRENQNSNTITISIGAIEVTNYTNLDTDELYRLTDEQLYRAKENGRNQVVADII